jgi:glucose/arabinose dehydrogenase
MIKKSVFQNNYFMILVLALFTAGCSAQTQSESPTDVESEAEPETSSDASSKLKLTLMAEDFESPLFLTGAPHDDRLFVVQQNGVIVMLEDGERRIVLDIRDRVTHKGEAGLLGLALHPQFLENGVAYASYTTGNLTSVIEEFRFNEESGSFDAEKGRVIYTLEQPAGNHNGGMIAFGPDGYLYLGLGDGGGGNDTYDNGQNFDTALGTMVRIGVDPDGAEAFSIPDDNPNIEGPAPEAWVYGLRNPWRFSFDGEQLYIADVGQSGEEEIDVIAAGAVSSGHNLGWPLAEGNSCLKDSACREKDIVWPIATYPTRSGCSITGGYVYRGAKIPALNGHYFYADFCSGQISSLFYDEGEVSEQRSWDDEIGRVDLISSFGRDGFGELYVVSITGSIYRLDPDE